MPDILHKVGIKSSSLDDVYKALTTLEGLCGWWTTDTQGDSKVGGVIVLSLSVAAVAPPGIAGAALLTGAPMAVAALAIAVAGIETRGRSLEAIGE